MHRYGIDVAPFDDTMLISYVLDAGAARTTSPRSPSAGSATRHPVQGRRRLGQEARHLRLRRHRARHHLRHRRRRHHASPLAHAEAAARRRRAGLRLRAAGAAAGPGAGAHGRARHLGRPADASPAVGRVRAARRGARGRRLRAAGERFTIGSPKQLGDILFGKMGLPGGSKTKSGQWSTTAQLLEELAAEGHELPRRIVDWRQLTKLKSTYTDALPEYINPETKRLHTSYALASTPTGRISSSEPNLQNIPIRTAEGRRIRTAFIADPGNKLISADYSQIELRVLAHIADIPQLRQAFEDGIDIHAMTASRDVRRAGRGHAVRGAPPRQGDQFRHHLRHLGLRPRQPAVDRALRGRRLHQEVFRALPGHPGLHGQPQADGARQGLCRDDLRPAHPLSGDTLVQPVGALLQRARLDQRADPGLRRRHHPPRHDPHGRRAGARRAFGAHAAAGA